MNGCIFIGMVLQGYFPVAAASYAADGDFFLFLLMVMTAGSLAYCRMQAGFSRLPLPVGLGRVYFPFDRLSNVSRSKTGTDPC